MSSRDEKYPASEPAQPDRPSLAVRIFGFVFFGAIAAGAGLLAYVILGLANSPIGTGGGGGIALVAVLVSVTALIAAFRFLFSRRD